MRYDNIQHPAHLGENILYVYDLAVMKVQRFEIPFKITQSDIIISA